MLLRPFKFYGFWTGFGAGPDLANKRQAPTALPNRLILLVTALFVTRLVLPAFAGEDELRHDKSRFQTKYWTVEDGLPQTKISCLKQTRDGYLWIGTHFGLSRFDGLRFTSFNEVTTPQIKNESIDALAEDSEGILWIGTAGGLLSYRNQDFKPMHITTQQNQGVRRLCAARNGGLWLCTEDSSIVRLANGRFTCAWKRGRQGDDDIISMREGANGWLNIFTRSQWLKVSPDGTEIQTNAVRQSLALAWTAASPGDDSGSTWIGTKQGLFEVNGENWKPIAEDVLGTNGVEFIFQDKAGNLWASSRNEIFGKWDGKHWQTLDLGDMVEKGSGICMEQDGEGTFWVATEGGLVQLHEPLAVAYTKRDGIAHNKVWSVCEGNDREIWVGTDQGLTRINHSGEIATIPFIGPAANGADRCVWPKRTGGVWIAKNNNFGLYSCQNGHFEQAAASNVLRTPITCLAEGRSGLLYVGTEGCVFGFRQEAPLPWSQPVCRFDVPGVRSMLEASDGTFWLGTDGNGAARVRHDVTNYFTQQDGLSGNHVWSILENKDGALWFGTDKGLTRYQKGSFFSFTTRHGLVEDQINCVLEDDGYLWLSGQLGICRAQVAELNAVAEGRLRLLHPFALGTADGLKSAETNGEKQPAGWKARDGRLWFPTTHGVVVIDPKTFPFDEAPPSVIIEQVLADTNVIRLGTNVTETKTASSSGSEIRTFTLKQPIPAGKGHVLEFQYTATSLVDPKRVKFRYRLVNARSDWREETSDRRVSYINLRPGDYRFQVKACNHHNVWTPEPVEFAFSLAPHFWQTKPFYGLSGAAVLGIAAGIQAYRLRWQQRLLKLEQQRALAAERARIARDLHDDLGTALTGLALELDVIGRDPKPDLPVIHRLGQSAQRTRDLAERMREVVWSVNPRCDTVSSLASFLEQQIGQFLRADHIKVELDFPEDIPPLPIDGEARHQLALGVREALTNVIRHANATKVVLSLAIDKEWLLVRVKDNGRGLQASGSNGDGLRNMHDRLQSIGGTFDFSSEPGSGTTITFRVPLNKSKSGKSL
jgi:signal transduction histidine kinase/ligand-binding sensor domain-containing protein